MAAAIGGPGRQDPGRRVRPDARPPTIPTRSSRRWPGDRAMSGRPLAGSRSVCGVGCGGPMGAGGETVSPLNIRGWREFPLRSPAGRPGRPAGHRRQRRQGAGPRRGVAGGGSGHRQLSGHGGVHRRRWRHRARRPAARRRPAATPVTSATWWSSPTADRALAEARGCLEAEASGLSIESATGHPAADGVRRSGAEPERWSVGPWPRWPTCSDLRAGGRGRIGRPGLRGARSSTPPRRRSSSGPDSISRGRPGSSRPGSAPTGRWWGGRRGASGPGRWPARAGCRGDPARARPLGRRWTHGRASWRVPWSSVPICGGPRSEPCAAWPSLVGGGRRPYLPLPDDRLWGFRMVTAYGSADAVPEPARRDLLSRVVSVDRARWPGPPPADVDDASGKPLDPTRSG